MDVPEVVVEVGGRGRLDRRLQPGPGVVQPARPQIEDREVLKRVDAIGMGSEVLAVRLRRILARAAGELQLGDVFPQLAPLGEELQDLPVARHALGRVRGSATGPPRAVSALPSLPRGPPSAAGGGGEGRRRLGLDLTGTRRRRPLGRRRRGRLRGPAGRALRPRWGQRRRHRLDPVGRFGQGARGARGATPPLPAASPVRSTRPRPRVRREISRAARARRCRPPGPRARAARAGGSRRATAPAGGNRVCRASPSQTAVRRPLPREGSGSRRSVRAKKDRSWRSPILLELRSRCGKVR